MTPKEQELAALVREFQIHDKRGYGGWTSGMHSRADAAIAAFGYPPVSEVAHMDRPMHRQDTVST